MKLPRFFADECCPQPLVKALRAIGYDVEYVIEGAVGLADVDQARVAFAGNRILISADYDFGELAIRHEQPFTGLVILAPNLPLGGMENTASVAERIALLADSLPGRLTIIEQDRVRQRRL